MMKLGRIGDRNSLCHKRTSFQKGLFGTTYEYSVTAREILYLFEKHSIFTWSLAYWLLALKRGAFVTTEFSGDSPWIAKASVTVILSVINLYILLWSIIFPFGPGLIGMWAVWYQTRGVTGDELDNERYEIWLPYRC